MFSYFPSICIFYFIVVALSVFVMGALIQVKLSRKLFIKLENMDMPKEIFFAKVINLEKTEFMLKLPKVYKVTFDLGEDGIKEFNIKKHEFKCLVINTQGELKCQGINYIDFSEKDYEEIDFTNTI